MTIRLRLKCAKHNAEITGRAVDAPDGRRYKAKQPFRTGRPMLVRPGKTFGNRARDDAEGHLREAMEAVDVLLDSEQAERWTFGSDRWGSLPAYCRRCVEVRFVPVVRLRSSAGDIFV
jgi:hypothetical protein